MLLRRFILSMVLVVLSTLNLAAETELVMVEEHGCVWCARWNDEIAEIYPKTPEGKAAPLRRIDIHGPRPDDITFERGLFFTPTFVLTVDGSEVARLEGYPGEDFFWGMLGTMLERAQIDFRE
ncbi:hypothetical protein OS190_12465 [Sulfitobacter sp. F26204]|uniref:hypothetical protein n=1 Tax=Sulfitobacter sp. F26204 TaxID=2996014 RepID=UPI00225E5BD8|nr:hypothetical protein [Sulfitobacter sp. F26204]MCX7560383.1 hypothetical protein [Sulfitobacter sp. F26204]